LFVTRAGPLRVLFRERERKRERDVALPTTQEGLRLGLRDSWRMPVPSHPMPMLMPMPSLVALLCGPTAKQRSMALPFACLGLSLIGD